MEQRERLLASGSIRSSKSSWQSNLSTRWENVKKGIGDFYQRHVIRRSKEDDAVSIGIKQLARFITISLLLWELSFVIIMFEAINFQVFSFRDWPMFLPMWIGSVFGILVCFSISWQLCRNAKLVTRERRMYINAQGINDSGFYVDYESLPLMRRLFCWNIIVGIGFVFVLLGQIFFYRWFNHPSYNLVEAVGPIIILIAIFSLYMISVNVFSRNSCILFVLTMASLMLFAAKSRGHLSTWRVWQLTLPVIFIQFTFLYYLIKLLIDRYNSKIALKSWQKGCWALYACASLSSCVGIVDSICADQHFFITQSSSTVPSICWAITVVLVAVSMKVVLNAECNHLAKTRGFHHPMILSRTKDGWEASSSGNPKWTWMFGTLRGVKRGPSILSMDQDSDEESVVTTRTSSQRSPAAFVQPPPIGNGITKKLQFTSRLSTSNPSSYGATVTSAGNEEMKGITHEIELQQFARC